jgi:hypothetical protein
VACDRRRRDDAGREAARLRLLEEGRDDIGVEVLLVDTRRGALVHRDDAAARLHAGHDRAHRAGGVGYLLVGVVGLDERHVREALEGERVLLAGLAALLPLEDPRGDDRVERHAVTEEEDHVARR